MLGTGVQSATLNSTASVGLSEEVTFKERLGNFPGGPVVRTPCFHCTSLILRSCMPGSIAKKKKKDLKEMRM